MIRRVIHIDEDKCTGCGICVNACHEGAIGLVDGKAKLLRDDYCDGLGDCLPACPEDAITFVEREAAAYDEAAVRENLARRAAAAGGVVAGGCPGAAPRVVRPQAQVQACPGSAPRMVQPAPSADAPHAGGCPGARMRSLRPEAPASTDEGFIPSQLCSWPIEIKLVPIRAPYFEGAHILVAADCTAFAFADFHRTMMQGRTTVIGCPKLDEVDYAEKLSMIFAANDIQSVTVARMEVPCCGGLENAARRALAASGKDVPFNVVTVSISGELL